MLQWIPFEVMLDVMEFVLDNAFVQMRDGKILKQIEGIPMGGPLSPGMTIITCAWMENLYLETLTSETKEKFTAARFMDDILMVYAKSESWDFKKFTEDFEKSECYWPPLQLEEGLSLIHI